MFSSGDDFVLKVSTEVAEIVTVTGHPHDQPPITIGILLCGQQRCGIHDVELHMMAAHCEVAAHEVYEPIQPVIAFEQRGRELLIEQCAVRASRRVRT